MQKRETFLRGRIHVSPILTADAYTISSNALVSQKAKDKSIYNMTNRYSPNKTWNACTDSRMVLYGLTDYIRNNLTKPISKSDVNEAEKFMSTAHSFGGPLSFDRSMWDRVVKEFGGYLPIKIESLPEGSTFFPNEPIVQVSSLASGFGEVAASVEAGLLGMVSIATARATLTRHFRDKLELWCKKQHPTWKQDQIDGVVDWFIHDFGMRASSCTEESEILGRAHLLSFNGTDTFNAAFQARQMGGSAPIGTSILALAHRIVQGYKHEKDAYGTIHQASGGTISSMVGDCYNFERAVSDYLVDLAKKNEGVVVARPDSGNYVENVRFVCRAAIVAGLFTKDEQDRPKATTLRFIQGDSMTFSKVQYVLDALFNDGLDPFGWGIFGIGGYLRNSCSRDSLSSAYKLCAIGHENKAVIKLGDGVGKLSVPGPTKLLRDGIIGKFSSVQLRKVETDCGAYQTYFDGSDDDLVGDVCLESFDTVRNRAIMEFREMASVPSNFGLPENTCLSKGIRKLQNATLEQYRIKETSNV